MFHGENRISCILIAYPSNCYHSSFSHLHLSIFMMHTSFHHFALSALLLSPQHLMAVKIDLLLSFMFSDPFSLFHLFSLSNFYSHLRNKRFPTQSMIFSLFFIKNFSRTIFCSSLDLIERSDWILYQYFEEDDS